MRASVFVASAFVAVVFAQDSSSANPAPQTTLTTQTDSLGVVTGQPTQPGQPTQATNQPPLVTSQPAADTIPAVGTTGIVTVTKGNPDNTTSTIVVSVNNSTTSVMKPTLSAPSDASGSGGSSTPTGTDANGQPSASGSGTSSSSSGAAAATMRAVAGSLVGAGAFVAAFL